MKLRIGTRKSKLALAQSRWVKEKIESRHPEIDVELVKIQTTGDRILDSPLNTIGGKGLFVKEIEEALISKKVDLAVHSMKDVPAELPPRLSLTVFPEREDPFDAFISVAFKSIRYLPAGGRVGTSSLRRSSQLLSLRPDLVIVSLRGNVDTRIRKLEAGEIDAVILAAAGLNRLGLSNKINSKISDDLLIPAIGQGVLGLEVRSEDKITIEMLGFLNHRPTELAVKAERALLKELEGGCQVPIAGFAQIDDGKIRLRGMVAELDGSRIIKDEITGDQAKAEDLGRSLARRLLEAGADRILSGIYGRA